MDLTKIPRKKIDAITVPPGDRMTVKAKVLLTKDEIEAMIDDMKGCYSHYLLVSSGKNVLIHTCYKRLKRL